MQLCLEKASREVEAASRGVVGPKVELLSNMVPALKLLKRRKAVA